MDELKEFSDFVKASLVKHELLSVVPPDSEQKSGPAGDNCGEPAPKPSPLDEVLRLIDPARELGSGDADLEFQISKKPSTRADVLDLQAKFEALLRDKQAGSSGIDPVRRTIFTHALDEIIRQTAVESPLRGLLLLRVRDEAMMTLDTYRSLFEEAVEHGCWIADQGYQERLELQKILDRVEASACEARNRADTLRNHVDHTVQRLKDLRHMEQQRMRDELQFIRRANQLIRQEAGTLVEIEQNKQGNKAKARWKKVAMLLSEIKNLDL